MNQISPYLVTDKILKRVESLLDWYKGAQNDPKSKVLPHPIKDRWKKWDDNRLWCSFFFCIGVPGGSKIARDYIEPIEEGFLEFELHPNTLLPLNSADRLMKIWKFGRGQNRLNKALGRFFSIPQNFGASRSCEYKINQIFSELAEKGFMKWFKEIDMLENDRKKADSLQYLHGVKQKVSRDFLNDIGMTDSVIPLDVHTLSEMSNIWDWKVPKYTPQGKDIYLAIEDGVRGVANTLNCTVVEIDKSIYFAHMTKEF